MALVDAGRIKQVFWNLARNAVQAMPEGGSLRIRLIGSSRGARVVFEDSGVGMSTDQVDNVFRPFVSGSDSGTGLGLAIVYRIMELHGARIEVESENGKGTRFVLHFEDAAVPGPGEQTVVVEGQNERGTRLFDELSRTIEDAVCDLCRAFGEGTLPNSMDDDRYYNVRTMKSLNAA